MKKTLLFILVLLIFGGTLFAQYLPSKYALQSDNSLKKVFEDATPAGNDVSDMIVHEDTIWAGSGKGVSLSTDNGDSWKNFYGTKVFGTENISAIGYDNGIIWVATAHSVEKNGESLPEGSGLHYTTDDGMTWISVPQPLDAQSDTIVTYGINHLRALPVTVAVQNIVYDIAFTPGTVWIATFAGGLRKSTDMGKTWQRVVLPPDYLDSVKPTDTLNFCMQPVSGKFCKENNLNYRAFSVISTNDSTIYAGTADGINKSTDNGISWVKFTHTNEEHPISGNFIVALDYNKASSTIWSASWQAEGQTEFNAVSASSDGGKTWNIYLNGEKAHNLAFKDKEVIALTDDGAFRTDNEGERWITPTSIIDAKTDNPLTTNVFYSGGTNNNIIWLGSGDGLAKLDEAGAMWDGNWTIYFASKILTSTNDTYAFPNPFSPKQDVLKIKYSTGGKSEPVTIRIFDFGMHYIRTIIQNAQRSNPTHGVDNSNGVIDYWDGKDDNGNVVPNGVYFYRVDVGSDKPVFGKILVLQ